MKKIGDALQKTGWQDRLKALDVTAFLSHPLIADFIKTHQLTQDQVRLSLPKFNQFLLETERFVTGDVTYLAKGYEPILVMNEGYADVSYRETKGLKEAQARQAVAERIQLMNLPKTYKQVTFDDVDFDDVGRSQLLQALVAFVTTYPQPQKGLYIYGDMGIGKSYLMAALAHELAEKGAGVLLLHYPSFVLDIKNAINTGKVKETLDQVKSADVLILDDIGAEQSTSWVRDEILQVILQHRMQEELPTFFTSNYSLNDLERKLATTRTGDETWQAKRVMERVRSLALAYHLQGENRRN